MTTLSALIARTNRNPRDLVPRVSDGTMWADMMANVLGCNVVLAGCACIPEAFRGRRGKIVMARETMRGDGAMVYQIKLHDSPAALVLDAGHFERVRG